MQLKQRLDWILSN